MTIEARNAGSWKLAAPYVFHAGTWKLATSVEAYNAGVWKVVAQKLASGTVTNDGPKANGTPVTLGLTVVGGYGALTYSWARTSFTAGAGNITGSSTGATVNITGGTDAEADFTCTITDSLTGDTTPAIGSLTWGTPP
jgi:hypothetical protein